MASNFPATSLDTYATLVDNTDDVLAAHANDRGDAIENLEIKVGIDSSVVTTTLDYFLKHASGAYRTHVHDGGSDDGATVPITNTSGTLALNRGGTALTTVAAGSILAANSADTLSAVTSAADLKVLKNNAGTISWNAVTGTGDSVMATSPTLVTPTIGVATATSVNKVAITAPAASATLTIANGKTLTASNTITFTATDGSTLAIGTGGTLGTAAYTATTAYEASGGITTHAAVTATHGATGAVVGTTNSQTLSSKTLTTPLIDTINEETSANGVTIDSLNIKDGKLNTNNSVVEANITNGVVSAAKIKSEALGTWVPAIYKDDGSTSLTATVDVARYIQVGRRVIGNLTLSGVGNPSGNKIFFDLPVSSNSIAKDRGMGAGFASNNTSPTMCYLILDASATTKGIIYLSGEATWSSSGGSSVSVNFEFEAAA